MPSALAGYALLDRPARRCGGLGREAVARDDGRARGRGRVRTSSIAPMPSDAHGGRPPRSGIVRSGGSTAGTSTVVRTSSSLHCVGRREAPGTVTRRLRQDRLVRHGPVHLHLLRGRSMTDESADFDRKPGNIPNAWGEDIRPDAGQSPAMTSDIAVVICTRDRPELLRRAIAAIADQTFRARSRPSSSSTGPSPTRASRCTTATGRSACSPTTTPRACPAVGTPAWPRPTRRSSRSATTTTCGSRRRRRASTRRWPSRPDVDVVVTGVQIAVDGEEIDRRARPGRGHVLRSCCGRA